MAVRLQLENGEIKEYSTFCYGMSPEFSGPSIYYTKCGIQTKEWENSGGCDHLDCALEAVKHGVMIFTVLGAFFIPIMFIASYYETRNLLESISETIDFLILWGILGSPVALLSLKPWLELNEFVNHGTIRGIKARKL